MRVEKNFKKLRTLNCSPISITHHRSISQICGVMGKSKNGDPRTTHLVMWNLKAINNLAVKYFLSYHSDKYAFIIIWKARYKFRILGLFKFGMENDGAQCLPLSCTLTLALPPLGSCLHIEGSHTHVYWHLELHIWDMSTPPNTPYLFSSLMKTAALITQRPKRGTPPAWFTHWRTSPVKSPGK